jgi:DNA polymerase-3 subunit gamma/tau
MDDTPIGSDDNGSSNDSSDQQEALMPGLDLPETAEAAPYQVLARKYRPGNFEDLIGQDAMVRTLTNAFDAGRIAHAYMLTGVRGVGKTTTARLIARALNFQTDEIDAPSMALSARGAHCDAIARSTHVDVMEMDAASRTGVGDIREILDGVRYAPVSARYKVYIIDEVHMLSNNAFNALLKTLEEPPEHAKFIFATTEIRKVPVTVLSRCQRFDLKRIDRDVLTDHLERICGLENASVERDGLSLICRAAEGSVRDALSLLDQAIVQGADTDTAVTAPQIRDMLGLADRGRVLDLLEHAVSAKTVEALAELGSLYDAGGDPAVITRDLLDYVHATSRVKAVGPNADLGEAADTVARITALADSLSLAQLTRLWKLLLGGLDDVRTAPDQLAAAEMTILRLVAACMLPSPEDAARLLSQHPAAPADREAPGKPEATAPEPAPDPVSAAQPASTVSTPEPVADGPGTWEELMAFLQSRRDIHLQLDVERFVRPVSVKAGSMTYQPVDGAPQDLAQRLAKRLLEWTGVTWAILADADLVGGETWSEKRKRDGRERLENISREPAVAEALRLFPGAEIIKITDPEPVSESDNEETAENRA